MTLWGWIVFAVACWAILPYVVMGFALGYVNARQRRAERRLMRELERELGSILGGKR